jgi:hypothetical protein
MITGSRRAPAGLVAVLLVAVAACGVQQDDEPRALDAENVPFSLLAPTTTGPPETVVGDGEGTSRVVIYLSGADGLLWPTPRQVRGDATVAKAIEVLLVGATEEEADAQLSSFITSDTRLLGVEGPVDGVITVDLSRELLTITGRRQIQALAQVVFTATSLPSVDRVLFKFDGEQREVPNGDGELTASPLGRRHFRSFDRATQPSGG